MMKFKMINKLINLFKKDKKDIFIIGNAEQSRTLKNTIGFTKFFNKYKIKLLYMNFEKMIPKNSVCVIFWGYTDKITASNILSISQYSTPMIIYAKPGSLSKADMNTICTYSNCCVVNTTCNIIHKLILSCIAG